MQSALSVSAKLLPLRHVTHSLIYLSVEETGRLRDKDIVPDEDPRSEVVSCCSTSKTDKRVKSESSRTLALGQTSKEAREGARSALDEGSCVSASGRNGVLSVSWTLAE